MFSQVSVCPQGAGLCPVGLCPRGGLCPGESLSRGVSVRGVSVQGVSVQGASVQGGLCPGGSLFSRVCVRGGLCLEGGLCPGGPCPGRRSLSREGVSVQKCQLCVFGNLRKSRLRDTIAKVTYQKKTTMKRGSSQKFTNLCM